MKSKNHRKRHLTTCKALHRGRFGRCGELCPKRLSQQLACHPHHPWNLSDWRSLRSPSEQFQPFTRHDMRLGPKQTINSMYSQALSACWSNTFTHWHHILAILRSTRCHSQRNWILDSGSATKIRCIEPFRLLLSALGIVSAVFAKCNTENSFILSWLQPSRPFVQETRFVGWRHFFYKDYEWKLNL